MRPVEKLETLLSHLRLGPSRLESTELRSREISDTVQEIRQLARSADANDGALIRSVDHLLQVVLSLNHEVMHRHDWPEQIGDAVDGRVDEAVARLVGHIEVVRRALEVPERNRAFDETAATLTPSGTLEAGLSVLITTWNHATRVDRALDGAIETVGAERVVVLDDASTDDTVERLADRPEPFQVIRATANLGLTRARNVLLRAVTTTHAVFLDADNEIDPAAMRRLHSLAERWDAVVTHGVQLQIDREGRPTGILSAMPMNAEFFSLRHNAIDALAVIDVAAVRAVGGYTLDPSLELVEDWDMWHRLAGTGGLLVHAPFPVGRKLRSVDGMAAQDQDHTAQFARIQRIYRFDQRLDDSTVASSTIHPDIGPVWASAAAVRIRPELGEVLQEQHHDAWLPSPEPVEPSPPSVLVVAAAGVRDLGDDATTIETVRRLHTVVGTDIAIEIVTDGARPIPELAPAIWLGTLDDYAHRPLLNHVAVVLAGGGTLAGAFDRQTRNRSAVVDEARRAGIPVLLTGQGIGPVEGVEDVLESMLGSATAISCRDHNSAEIARSLGARDVAVIGDDAAGRVGPSLRDLPKSLAGLEERGWIVFNARLADHSDAEKDGLEAWADLVDSAARDRGLPVVAVAQSQQPPWEIETLSELAGRERRAPWMVVDCTDDIPGARACYGLAAAGVVRSYHAAWFALAGGVPVLFPASGEYYEAKSSGLRDLLDLDHSFDDDRVPTDTVELDRRWTAVADVGSAKRISAVDAEAIEWLRDQLPRAGVLAN